MKRLLPILLMIASPLLAEEVTVKQSALLKADRSAVSIKPGTVVELVSRHGADVTIRYKNLTGKIPASALEEPKTAAAPTAKPSPPKPTEKKPAAQPKPPEAAPANPPQTTYGKAVQKAKDNAGAHEKNLVKPADEVLK